MAAYLRNVLQDYEISELVSLEWCAKESFPGADIVPILIFLRNRPRPEKHRIRLVSGITSLAELTNCITDKAFLESKSAVLPFDEWALLSANGDWCLDVAETDLPVLQKLNARQSIEQQDVARCSFAIKAGNHQEFLRKVEGEEPKADEVPLLKGQHVAAFNASNAVDEYANLASVETADDASIWKDLDFFRANQGKADVTGMGRYDYVTPERLGSFSPSDTLCCVVPEIYVTLVASVIDPLKTAANNSTIVLVPKKYSAYCLAAILNSRVLRYYAFLTQRSAILLRRRTTWFPRAIKALPMPELTKKTAKALHELAKRATILSAGVAGSEAEAYLAGNAKIEQFKKAAFLGVQFTIQGEIDREDLADAKVSGNELHLGTTIVRAPNQDLLTLLRAALLATDNDEFAAEDLENALLPADESARTQLAHAINDFAAHIGRTEVSVRGILEEIDEIVAAGLGLTPKEHEIIKQRCQQFPLSVTVERPRFAWSADRKSQARRVYKAGERFK
jgi:hypothetical protein